MFFSWGKKSKKKDSDSQRLKKSAKKKIKNKQNMVKQSKRANR